MGCKTCVAEQLKQGSLISLYLQTEIRIVLICGQFDKALFGGNLKNLDFYLDWTDNILGSCLGSLAFCWSKFESHWPQNHFVIYLLYTITKICSKYFKVRQFQTHYLKMPECPDLFLSLFVKSANHRGSKKQSSQSFIS